jgi:amino acid transporter
MTIDTTSAGAVEKAGLKGHIGVFELVFISLGSSAPLASVVGFLAFAIVFAGIGAPGLIALVMALVLVFSVGYTAMARYLPNPGAFYAFITAGLGRAAGLGGALLAVYFYFLATVGSYMFFGIAADNMVHELFGGPHIAWYWYTLVSLAAVAILSYFNIELSGKVLTVLTAVMLGALALFVVVTFARGGAQGISLQPFTWHAMTSGTVGVGLLFGVLYFMSFEICPIFREECKRPEKTVPRATYIAVVVIGLARILPCWALITAFGVSHIMPLVTNDPAGAVLTAMTRMVGKPLADACIVLVMTAMFGAVLALTNVMARYFYSFGVDGALPRFLGRAHPRHHSPYIASLFTSVLLLICLLAFIFTGADPSAWYGRIMGVASFAMIIVLLLTSLSVIAFFRSRRKSGIKEATAWHRTIAPLIASVGMAALLYEAVVQFATLTGRSRAEDIVFQVMTWGVLLVGILLTLWYRSRRPEVYERIGRQDV